MCHKKILHLTEFRQIPTTAHFILEMSEINKVPHSIGHAIPLSSTVQEQNSALSMAFSRSRLESYKQLARTRQVQVEDKLQTKYTFQALYQRSKREMNTLSRPTVYLCTIALQTTFVTHKQNRQMLSPMSLLAEKPSLIKPQKFRNFNLDSGTFVLCLFRQSQGTKGQQLHLLCYLPSFPQVSCHCAPWWGLLALPAVSNIHLHSQQIVYRQS